MIDRTGVGRAVYDMFIRSGISATITGVSITAGSRPGAGTVPKVDLVAAVQATLGTHRLKIAPGLAEAQTLAKELESFRAKITPDRNETFSSWREKDHDDLVLALALAVHAGEMYGIGGGCPVSLWIPKALR